MPSFKRAIVYQCDIYLVNLNKKLLSSRKKGGQSVGPQLPILLENGSWLKDWYFKSCLEDEEWKSLSPKCWPIVDLIRGPHKQESQKGQLTTWLRVALGQVGNATFLQLFVAYLTADLSKRWWTNLAGLNSWLQIYWSCCTSFWSYRSFLLLSGKRVSQPGNFRPPCLSHTSFAKMSYVCAYFLEES